MTFSAEAVSAGESYGKSVLLTLVCFTSSELDPLDVYVSVLYEHQATIRPQVCIFYTPYVLYVDVARVYNYTAWGLGVARCFNMVQSRSKLRRSVRHE